MADDSSLSDYDPRIDEAKQFLKLANDADTMNRQEALEDLKYLGFNFGRNSASGFDLG
mgnify:CR=1 FL=1